MHFENNNIYHVYNQGNNGQIVFFNKRNYLYFIKKMERYILPYADILCYCLMPNHFHWLLRVNHVQLNLTRGLQRKKRTINDSIGILLRTYARAINNQNGNSGSLFRQGTKAKTEFIDGFITVDSKNKDHFFSFDNKYIALCFEYIHQNPVKAEMVKKPEEWEYSSARDYKYKRKLSICNRILAKELLNEQKN